MKANSFFKMVALMLGMTISSVMFTSCTAEDNPVGNVPGDVPNVGATTVKELSELTTAEVGWVIAADGKAYMNSAAAKAANTEALAMFSCITESVDGSHWGYAIQITDCPFMEVSWEEAKEYVKSLPEVEGANWYLPDVADWEEIFKGCAITGDATERTDNSMKPINGFRDKMLAACPGWQNAWYWTSAVEGSSNAWIVGFNLKTLYEGEDASASFANEPQSYPYSVRGLLIFSKN